ncbi:MAG: hypothetical protein JWP91_1451 [Fibrobacteres bacterium]|nr:hypothetical protein [Fibrobacterota bacterium]
MDEFEEERIMAARRMARKLARNKSRSRTVRKLPQSMVIVPRQPRQVFPVRKAINQNKRLTYIVLLGAVLCAYWYDVDLDTLEFMMQVVSKEAHQHIPGVNLESLGLPGVS